MASGRDLFSRIKAAARKLAAHFRTPAMIGTPPSARPIRHDPAAYARDFSERYAQDLDLIVPKPIQELDIPDQQYGRPDPNADGRWRGLFPDQGGGGGVGTDSGGRKPGRN